MGGTAQAPRQWSRHSPGKRDHKEDMGAKEIVAKCYSGHAGRTRSPLAMDGVRAAAGSGCLKRGGNRLWPLATCLVYRRRGAVVPCGANGSARLIADIQQRKANDIIRPSAAIRPLDANDGITAFSEYLPPPYSSTIKATPPAPTLPKADYAASYPSPTL